MSGQYDVAVAGGVEVMSRVPMGSTRIEGLGSPFGPDIESRYGVKGFNQGVSADLIARRWSLSRTQLDEHSLQSHARAAAAQDEGRYAAEIAAVETTDAAGQPVTTMPTKVSAGAGRWIRWPNSSRRSPRTD
jgi:acetyl-CoA acyltransferase